MIREQGLRRLTETLIRERIERARDAGAVASSEAEALLRSHVFARGLQAHRENQVCFTLSRTIFDHDPRGCEPLLSIWGGEGIYFACGADWEPRLRQLGTPTIVSAALDITGVPTKFYPSLLRNFAARTLGLEDIGADVFYGGDVPAVRILDFFQPGRPEYDRYVGLPRA
ncbi:MAG: hypothetical protein ACT4TC_19840 [Myxococcaceae bacterium]